MLLYAACANAQQEFLCTQINQPATAAFDFTDDLTRWGNTNVYNIDDAPHRVRSITINTLPIFDFSDWAFKFKNRNYSKSQWKGRADSEKK